MGEEKNISLSQRKQAITDHIHKMIKERTDKILVLGELTYKRMRHANVEEKQFELSYEDIFQIDQSISAAKCELKDLIGQFATSTCECGNELGEHDQFCGECGAKVADTKQLTDENGIKCGTCEATIPAEASFCTACGHFVEKGA